MPKPSLLPAQPVKDYSDEARCALYPGVKRSRQSPGRMETEFPVITKVHKELLVLIYLHYLGAPPGLVCGL